MYLYLSEEVTDGTERCWGMQLWKVLEQVPGSNRELWVVHKCVNGACWWEVELGFA